MIEVKVFGSTPPCARCKEVTKRANRIAKKYPGKISVAHFDALSSDGEKYGIFLIPAIVINDKIVSAGKVPEEDEIEQLIKKQVGEDI
jgi:thiol-disulfide isomerase/thioredoxin